MPTPEHLHLALNHIPFLGAGLALIPLFIGFLAGQRSTIVAGLLIVAASGWMTPLVMETGESAYERYEKGPVASFLDARAETALEQHEHRAEAWAPVLYVSTIVSTIALALIFWKERWKRFLAFVCAAFCTASLLAGIWIANSGGLIRRPDFRSEDLTTPSSPKQNAYHDRESERD